MKTKNPRSAFLLICAFAFLFLTFNFLRADDSTDAYTKLKETTAGYFKDNKYNECADYLKSLTQKDGANASTISYFIALTRYNQLKYLEESQNWNEYFSSGQDYRQQVGTYAQEAIDATSAKDSVNVYARLILWRLHKDQGDAMEDGVLTELVNAALENAKSSEDARLLKDVADQVLLYEDKINSRRLYKAYVEKLAASKISDEELSSSASRFYEEQNLELSEALYDVYIGRIAVNLPKEKLIPVLAEIAKQFTYKPAGPQDMFYAEKVFAKIEETAGKEAFDEELLYLRAFNLEKDKDFAKSKDVYLDLINRFPQGPHINEAIYKTGMIYVYVLADLKEGRNYFEKLAQKETIDPQVISAFYQLGLLSQWDNDVVKAKEYYNKLIEIAKDGYAGKLGLTKERLKEIEESKPLEYNLKSFLDVSLKQENAAAADMTKADFKLTPYLVKKDENLNVGASASAGESGCMPIDLQYLWSGDLGSAKPSPDQHAFETNYSDSGVKQINLVVVSAAGIVGRSMDLADVTG